MRAISSLVFLIFIVSFSAVAKNAEFPGRSLYLDVKYIELADLAKEFKDVIIIDVRSKYEFDTLHIKNALHIAINSPTYISEIEALQKANPNKKIVTYCNGKTCMKSYDAVRKCQRQGIKNVVAYDAGIMDWARAHPDLAVLLGQSPMDPKRLIGKADFQKHLLDSDAFIDAARNDKNAIIIDARDPLQREGIALFMGLESRASLRETEEMGRLIETAARQNKTMYIYDEAGKQVEWLMYRLEDRAVKRYYFMKGGMNEYFKKLRLEMTN
ncbi:MAG: rhodanese-like domain-containing protein [Gammaproteobacteria bacterium]